MGILIVGFEKEIISLLWKMDGRRGHGVKASGGRGGTKLIFLF